MRHLIVTAALIVAALTITFGTASVLQGLAVARGPSMNPEPVVAEPSTQAPGQQAPGKQTPGKLRPEQGRQMTTTQSGRAG